MRIQASLMPQGFVIVRVASTHACRSRLRRPQASVLTSLTTHPIDPPLLAVSAASCLAIGPCELLLTSPSLNESI
jgi:hypothetical protein